MKFDLMFVIQEPCTVPGLLDIINVSRYFGSVRELGEGEETKLNVALINALISVVSLIKNKNAVCITTDTESSIFV